ncbi:PTS sugar transporter subunit IIA [Clostridium pasteurianum]|uniref:PTS system, mannose/fructose/sorbose family, IIA component n=1 Tax=Clostridium pasteurianum BC1 TaxID=86416 RepID=R4K7K5_CLOPA|nr:mannose/fructose/sorbose PTS transporter subunit IIA [Clostridium pasteurianum]AGK99172.1 PTS system, mannose/fructose/sorbose family, IIA component [Clostridium pasteurianum BC1]
MTAIIIGTHGKFSQEILRSSEMIFGKQENVSAVTFEPGEGPDDLVKKYEKELEQLDLKQGVLFLVDLFGGSPFNAASRIVSENKNMDIVTGINLPMLLEVYGVRDSSDFDELVDTAKKAAQDGVKSLREVLVQQEDDEL